MSEMFIRTARRSSMGQIRHVAPVRLEGAPDLVARVYAQVERDFGMLAPPISLHAPAPETLAASWLMLRETLVATGLVDRAAKETVGTGVSLGNACPYCVEIHGATLRGLIRRADAVEISGDRLASIRDRRLREIAAWARDGGTASGQDGAPFPQEEAPEYIGVAVTFEYLNRMVNVFLPESPLSAGLPGRARGPLMRLLARILRPATRRAHRPGDSLDLLPDALLPEGVSWAAGNPSIAGAFARASAAIEAAGRRSVPESVRRLVAAELDRAASGSGLAAAPDGPAERLPEADRPAGRLALLTALVSYRVGPSVIEDFRREHPDDRTLIELTSWASLTAALRIGGRLSAGVPPHGRNERTVA